jgi:pimeloyl-ACP methyl ester carboxylesterase
MSTVQVPIICICGEKDQNIPTNFLQKEMPVYFPAVSFIAIPDAGHLIPIEAPSALANVIADFAKKQIRRNWISLKL